MAYGLVASWRLASSICGAMIYLWPHDLFVAPCSIPYGWDGIHTVWLGWDPWARVPFDDEIDGLEYVEVNNACLHTNMSPTHLGMGHGQWVSVGISANFRQL